MIYCGYELKAFPDDQFRSDSVHGLVHKTVKPEHTTTGEVVGEDSGLPIAAEAAPPEGSDE